MDAVEGGAFRTSALEKASRNFVFVYQHQTREDSAESYRLITEEFLPEEFLHPVYLILRPDGTEADSANRHSHEALSAGQIQKMLDRVQKDWGKGLSGKDWEKSRADLARAEAALTGGRREEAIEIFEDLAKLRARCGVKDRAKSCLDLIEAADRLVAPVAAVDPGAGKRLEALDLVGAWRVLEKSSAEEAAPLAKAVLEEIRRFVRLQPVRLDRLLLTSGTLYYLRAEWATDLPPFDGLVLQLSYLTEAPKTFEGWAVYDEVGPARRHRAAFSMPSVTFRLRAVVNARAQLWLDGVLLHESKKAESPAEFPFEDESVRTGPDLLTESDSLGAGAKARLRSYQLGRYRPGDPIGKPAR